MVEKNYDPDNDNCPEKDTVENLHKSKMNSDSKMAEELGDQNSNRISKGKNDEKPDEDLNNKKR
jgi:hypothetical protein